MKAAELKFREIDHVAVPRNPYARMVTKIYYSMRMPSFARERAKVLVKFTGVREALADAFEIDPGKLNPDFHRVEHHQAHLASAFFVSPFERAALLSADGLGDFASTMWGTGTSNRMRSPERSPSRIRWALLHGVTQYLGFPKFGDEYKVMGLAAYGEPEHLETFRDIVRFNANGTPTDFAWGSSTSLTIAAGRR